MAKSKKPSGPTARTLKIQGSWEDAARKALAKKRPASGWPKPETRPVPLKKKQARKKPGA